MVGPPLTEPPPALRCGTDWRHQILFFEKQGYGLIVPDMLGYGGTDKPTTPEYYKASLICGDIIEIMNHENVNKAIAIGHDWCPSSFAVHCVQDAESI